jgi:hypothetical protein
MSLSKIIEVIVFFILVGGGALVGAFAFLADSMGKKAQNAGAIFGLIWAALFIIFLIVKLIIK